MRPVPAIAMPLPGRRVLAARRAGPEAAAEFEEAVRAYHGSHAAHAVSSARAALWLALGALKRQHPDRTRVILPAYTCPTVGRAVVAAGLEGLCVDISLGDFNLNPAQVERHLDERVLAVIAAHMFGTPCDLTSLGRLCREAGAVLVEDCAQACGARWSGRCVGGVGGLGVLSLGRSKNLRGAGGGVLLVNDPTLAEAAFKQVDALPPAGPPSTGELARQLVIGALSSPHAWNLAKRLPGLHVGAEDQSFDEAPTRLAPWRADLGSRALRLLDEHNALRADLGRRMEEVVAGVAGIQVQRKAPEAESAYVRFPLRLSCSRAGRDALQRSLQSRGIDARAFYTRAMPDYDWWPVLPDQQPCETARTIVDTNLVLPIYHAMDADEARTVTEAARTVYGDVCTP